MKILQIKIKVNERMNAYKNIKEKRTTIIISSELKRLIIKNKMNLSYFVREKLYAHFKEEL